MTIVQVKRRWDHIRFGRFMQLTWNHTWSNCRSLLSTMGNDLGSSRGVLTWTAPCLVKIASNRDNTKASSLAKVDTQFCVEVLFCYRDKWTPSVEALHRVGQNLSSKSHERAEKKFNFPSPFEILHPIPTCIGSKSQHWSWISVWLLSNRFPMSLW